MNNLLEMKGYVLHFFQYSFSFVSAPELRRQANQPLLGCLWQVWSILGKHLVNMTSHVKGSNGTLHVTSYLPNANPKIDQTCQSQPLGEDLATQCNSKLMV
jgi:hypothetical protein